MNHGVSITSSPQRHTVKTVTSGDISVLHKDEVVFYETARDKYLAEFTFTSESDKRALDRLLLLELEVHRAQRHLAADQDYTGHDLSPTERTALRRVLKEATAQISEIQKDLALTKAQREKGVDDLGEYLKMLKTAAKEQGIKRERELDRGITLCKELFALVGAFKRSNELERRKLGVESADDIVEWVWEYMRPEFDAVDEHFRQNKVKLWVRKL